MADILYTYGKQVYVNLTNKCTCSCSFCIRNHIDTVGDAETLWHKKDPTLAEVKEAMDSFDFTGCTELVYCGYGEPTCALDTLLESARYAKDTYHLKIRVNTNGLANLYHNTDIIPRLAKTVDSLSISLNAPTEEKYNLITRPQFDGAFHALLNFAREAQQRIETVQLSVVDVLPQEDIEDCRRLAEKIGVPLRVRKFT